jgi:Protein of unknown function (DUF2793)
MPNSPLLALPYLASAQAQKHVTHNEALSLIDGLLHLSVISRSLSTPPGVIVDGDRYLVAASPTGEWVGQTGLVALRMEGAWRFLTPRKGWRLWVEAENILLVFDGTSWTSSTTPTQLQNLTLLGVNATADATNKLVVSSSSVLFNHVGAGIQFKVNKNAATNTASLLFQDNFSGRAEVGLTGDDNLHFKVSADGSTFFESLIVSSNSGLVTLKNNAVLEPQAADPTTPANGQLWYNSTTGKFRARQNGANLDVIGGGGGGGVTDGDKGDIIVSGTGTVWSLDVPQVRTTLSINNVDNTSDLGKPVSTAQAASIATKEPIISAGTSAQYWRGDKAWVALDKTAVGLASVDNTSDLTKPVSTAQQAALNLKAPLVSPIFTGAPIAPTPTALSNNTTLATTAYADAADLVIATSVQGQIQSRFLIIN